MKNPFGIVYELAHQDVDGFRVPQCTQLMVTMVSKIRQDTADEASVLFRKQVNKILSYISRLLTSSKFNGETLYVSRHDDPRVLKKVCSLLRDSGFNVILSVCYMNPMFGKCGLYDTITVQVPEQKGI